MAQTKTNINWITTGIMIAFHVGAIAALFMFSWKALFVGLVVYWIAGSLGIGMGYHRLLTHRGYKCPKWVEYVLKMCIRDSCWTGCSLTRRGRFWLTS